MGKKYEVSEWCRLNNTRYKYYSVLMTDWLIVALLEAWKLKRNGAGCVKIEWR